MPGLTLAERSRREAEIKKYLDDGVDGSSPGTFRWSKEKKFPALPSRSTSPPVDKGWGPFLRARGAGLENLAQADPAFLDALSFPISAAWALHKVGAHVENVVVLGATRKAELRVLQDTRYWSELTGPGGSTPQIWLVGPEIGDQRKGSERVVDMAPPVASRFFPEHPELTPENTAVVVYNGGFGNFVGSGKHELLWSWLPDLAYLTERGFLCIFFAANDYADLNGECLVQHVTLRARFVITPQRNPFPMATTFTGESQDEWFCGNMYAYATQGGSPEILPDKRDMLRKIVQRSVKLEQTGAQLDLAAQPLRGLAAPASTAKAAKAAAPAAKAAAAPAASAAKAAAAPAASAAKAAAAPAASTAKAAAASAASTAKAAAVQAAPPVQAYPPVTPTGGVVLEETQQGVRVVLPAGTADLLIAPLEVRAGSHTVRFSRAIDDAAAVAKRKRGLPEIVITAPWKDAHC